MRFATFSADNKQYYGAVSADGVIALSADFPQWQSLRAVIADSGLAMLERAAAKRSTTHKNGEFRWDIPIPDAEKIICVGINFPGRNEEYKDNQAAAANPSLFIRFARSFCGHEGKLLRPKESNQLDYEGEIAVVIGAGGRRIAEENALGHIAAITLCNDGTLRDWVRHAKFNVTQGKNFDNSGAMGPWLVPYNEPSQLQDIRLQTRVNGDKRQEDTTSRMIFPIAKQISYISKFTTLVPGDIIVTGTPVGTGARMEPPVYLQLGDVVEVEADGIGVLRNVVSDE